MAFFFFLFLLQPSNDLFLSTLLVVLPLESLAHGLFHELGSCLGGTCVGYALVIPTAYCRYGSHKTHANVEVTGYSFWVGAAAKASPTSAHCHDESPLIYDISDISCWLRLNPTSQDCFEGFSCVLRILAAEYICKKVVDHKFFDLFLHRVTKLC